VIKYILALLLSIAPLPAYLGISHFYGENFIILVLFQWLSGLFIGILLNKGYWVIILSSAVIMSIVTAAVSHEKDALWAIACIIIFLITMIQFVSIKIGIIIKTKYFGTTELPNQSLKGRM